MKYLPYSLIDMDAEKLKSFLEGMYYVYARRELIYPDPLYFLYNYDNLRDREVVGLITSSLAYGRVAQIMKSSEKVLACLGASPREYLLKHGDDDIVPSSFKHRFTTSADMNNYLHNISRVLKEYGNIETFMGECLKTSGGELLSGLDKFAERLSRNKAEGSFSLMTAPKDGSACKRLFMYLRWFVRKDDVDFGGWEVIKPSELIVPLDTHMYHISLLLGLTSRKLANLRQSHNYLHVRKVVQFLHNYFCLKRCKNVYKKLLLTVFLVFALFAAPLSAAETAQELTTDYVTRIQNEISSDIAKLRPSVEAQLEDMSLTSSDIMKRINELADLTAKASDDMAAWGYSPEQRETHSRILSELSVAYAAYSALMGGAAPESETPASLDISSLGNIASPDINTSDNLRREITKTSRGLDVQVFYLQSKLSKLRLDLAEAASLSKQLKEAQEGGQALELPRTHVLNIEAAKMNVALSSLQVRAQKRAFDANVSVINRLRRRLSDLQGKLAFPQELLDANLEKLQTRLNELTEEMNSARKALDSANSSLIRARASLTSADTDSLTNASSALSARSARVNYWEHMLSMIEDEIVLTRETQQVWRDRFRLFHEQASGEDIWKLRENSQARLNELARQLEGVRTMESTTLREIDRLQEQAKTEGISSTILQNLTQAVDNQRKIVSDIFNRYESMIPNASFFYQRLYNEASDSMSTMRLAEKVGSFSKDTVMGFLNTELWQGEGYSVTVSKLIIAIAVFLSSFFLSSWGSKWLKRRMINRFKASVTAANAVQRITFYILWVAFALIALNIVKIPLTAFAFMGGAMAVGLGFGMQNIFNNLISGFIVIFSRPFKVNDIVEVAGTTGVVEDIGSRSTTIRTWDGLDVVLPNRYFLENSVTNWTGTDLKKREILKVGVSYDADSREVEKLLLEVVNGHSSVLKNPAPFVLFKNFGDDALEFEIYYWIELRKSSGAKVSSDMRHHIAAVFKREGIGIPYPQRDIHIISEKPESSENA